VNPESGGEERPLAITALGDALTAAVDSERVLAERATRLDAGDHTAARELTELLPERLAMAVDQLEALEAWSPPSDLEMVHREAVNALAFQALRWRMVAESLERALAGEIEAALGRRGASHGALVDQQRSWQLLGFTLQCLEAQRPAPVAALALPDEVRAALGLSAAPRFADPMRPEEMAAARLTIAGVPPRPRPGSGASPSAAETLTLASAAGVAAETLFRQLNAAQPEPEWLESARHDYLAIARRATCRLIDVHGGGSGLLSRLASAVAGRPIDLGAATADGYGTSNGLLWATIELDVSLPRPDNGWWAMTDDERMTLLDRLRKPLGWAAVAADAVVQPDTLTALDLPEALRPGAGLTWQQRLSPAPDVDRDAMLARLDRELAAVARERDEALDAWRRRVLLRMESG
jgi:hypothetical protein